MGSRKPWSHFFMLTPHKKFRTLLLNPDNFKGIDPYLEKYCSNLSQDTINLINNFDFEIGKLYKTISGPIKMRIVPFSEPFFMRENLYKKELIKLIYETDSTAIENKPNYFSTSGPIFNPIKFISIPKKTGLVFLQSAITFWQSGTDSVSMFYWCFLYGDQKIVYESTQFHSAYNTFFPV